MARKQYDHRIRHAIVKAGNPKLFPGLAIPDSTRRSWLARGAPDVVTVDARDTEIVSLHAHVARLEKRVAVLATVVRLLVTLIRVSGAKLAGVRVPSASGKRRTLHAVARAEAAIGRSAALRIVGLTPARAGAWSRRERACALDDAPPCPRTVPGRLTRDERGAIRDLVEAEEYKHLSLRSLARLGKRIGKVFASYETWSRLVRAHGWRRPRRRLYPAKPKVGLRASAANEWWHVDVTIIRLLDGTRTYLHAVVDNYSRRVLAWTLEERLCADGTRKILGEARQALAEGTKVNVMTDGGSENLVVHQDAELVAVAEHVVAQVDVVQWNSMVESLWNQLRHRWLYLHQLESFAGLESLIAKYFIDHNTLIPRAALGGRTPDEAYFGRAIDLAGRLEAGHAEARAHRGATNRAVSCRRCAPPTQAPPTPHLRIVR
ncbi:MAG: DDE-type integrase/transposase/recombinase [Sandaracinaceae bacterium]